MNFQKDEYDKILRRRSRAKKSVILDDDPTKMRYLPPCDEEYEKLEEKMDFKLDEKHMVQTMLQSDQRFLDSKNDD